MYVPRDTTPEAMRVQIEIWRRMTPEQRSLLAPQLCEDVRRNAMAGIQARHPGYSEEEVRLALYELIHGKEVVDRVWRKRANQSC
ncbi:MAG TPA: hypothetical protein VGN57_20180 [Pirellulaceae bacterium]|jgi:hypothetical protein|nr:hypothetical protein [Pirellulaceae bacterium]